MRCSAVATTTTKSSESNGDEGQLANSTTLVLSLMSRRVVAASPRSVAGCGPSIRWERAARVVPRVERNE
eukprot:6835869-Pyramimonas_sp.AAC.1